MQDWPVDVNPIQGFRPHSVQHGHLCECGCLMRHDRKLVPGLGR